MFWFVILDSVFTVLVNRVSYVIEHYSFFVNSSYNDLITQKYKCKQYMNVKFLNGPNVAIMCFQRY